MTSKITYHNMLFYQLFFGRREGDYIHHGILVENGSAD
jgi:hypothetical protein